MFHSIQRNALGSLVGDGELALDPVSESTVQISSVSNRARDDLSAVILSLGGGLILAGERGGFGRPSGLLGRGGFSLFGGCACSSPI